jgi:hypothetical protein
LDYRKEDHMLTAYSGDVVDPSYRFSTPELDELVKELRATKQGSIWDGIIVPRAALGEDAPPERGLMFREVDPKKIYKSDMIK